jgi:hypothetical protein
MDGFAPGSRSRSVMSARLSMKLFIWRTLITAAVIGNHAVMAQVVIVDTPQPPPLELLSDAEIVSALSSDNLQEKESVAYRAALLPPYSLRMDTVIAIGNEIIQLTRDVQARFKDAPLRANEGKTNGELIGNLARTLVQQKNPAGIDGLAAVLNITPRVPCAMAEFGEVAVPVLLRVAWTEPEADTGLISGAMDAFEMMLESPAIQRTLSPLSRGAIRQVAADRLRSTTGNDNWRTLVSAADLAVATGDPQLRKKVTGLIDDDAEFVRRGIDPEWQQEFARKAREALAKFPK